MRLAFLIALLAVLLISGNPCVWAQSNDVWSAASSIQSESLRAFPPPHAVQAAHTTPVAPAGQWVFVPEEGPALNSPSLAAEQLPPPAPHPLPAPAVTEFAQVQPTHADMLAAERLGPTLRIFEPKARVYFDTGWEAPDKLNLFHDGALSASINFLELYWQHRWPQTIGSFDLPLGHPDWRWGPAIGVGIAPQPASSNDGSRQSSGAPVLMMSAGLQFDFPLTQRYEGDHQRLPTAGLEVGYALGVSSDESLSYSADGAIYVGVSIHVLP